LVRYCFGELAPSRTVAKQTRGRGFKPAVGQTGRQFRVFRPSACPERSRGIDPPPLSFGVARIFGAPKWKNHVGQNVGDTGFADERHRFERRIGRHRVVKFPKWMIEGVEKLFDRGGGSLFQRATKCRPLLDQDCQCRQATLRMIDGAGGAEFANLLRQDQSLQSVAVRPPTVPQFAHIILCRLFVDREVRRFQKTGDTEKDRFSIFQVLAQSLQREPLRNERKRQLVLFITEGGRDFLKERLVSSVIVALGTDAGGFFLQTKLGGGIEHAPDAIFRQVSERRLATPRPSERNVGAERLRQNRRIDLDLRNVAVRFGAREEFAVAFVEDRKSVV